MSEFPVRRDVPIRRKRYQDVTPKNAGLGPPGPCRKCRSTNATAWVAVDVNRYESACVNCFDTAGFWAAICSDCGALRLEHVDNRCPRDVEFEEYERKTWELHKERRAIASAEPDIIEAEVVELPCTCSPPRYDGDDGYDRDCPQHGVGAVES